MDPRYPIGQYEPLPFSEKQKNDWLNDLKFLPTDVEMAIQNLDEYQLNTPYRNGGWMVKEVVHHVADSHMHAYARFKFGLTEDAPAIKPYDEAAWTLLNDVQTLPINISLTLLNALHQRWIAAIQPLDSKQWMRTVMHPQHKNPLTLWFLLGMYVWHGKHHTAHITHLREEKNW